MGRKRYKINETFSFHEDFHLFFPDISMEDIRDSLLTVYCHKWIYNY